MLLHVVDRAMSDKIGEKACILVDDREKLEDREHIISILSTSMEACRR